MTIRSRFMLLILGIIIFLMIARLLVYTVDEREQVILTQFGEIVGEPVTEAGLHMKVPFIQKVHRLEKRILEWDGPQSEIPTKGKEYIVVDTYARWRIQDPKQFFLRLQNEIYAQSRIDDILDSETAGAVARHELIELIRTTIGRQPVQDETVSEAAANVGKLEEIEKGRAAIEKEIRDNAAPYLAALGIELLDIRIKGLNYNPNVQAKTYERMISDRKQISDFYRSQGQGEAARLLGLKTQVLREIQSEAYKQIQQIRGAADARATQIYAEAYNASPEAADLYRFLQTMATYENSLGKDTTVILSTDSELFGLLKEDGWQGADASRFAELADRVRDESPPTTESLELEIEDLALPDSLPPPDISLPPLPPLEADELTTQ